MGDALDLKAAEIRRRYLKEWRKKNPEKMRQYNKTYWQRKAAKLEVAAENDGKTEEA